MFSERSFQGMTPYKDRPGSNWRKVTRREEDRLREQAHQQRARKLHSLLELGQIIGLGLQLNEMLLQIARRLARSWKQSAVASSSMIRRLNDFNAGGKGLDLLQMKVCGQRYGLVLSMESHRCIHIPTDQDVCPGRIRACPHCQTQEDCLKLGGSIFTVSFPEVAKETTGK